MRLLRFQYALTWLTLAFIRAAVYFNRQAVRDLQLPPAMALDSKAMRRLQHYFYGTTFLSIVFGLLHDRRRSAKEKYLFSNLAALSYYFDDLADAYQNEAQSQNAWIDNPEAYGRQADEKGIALHLLDNCYRSLPAKNLPAFKTYLHRVFNVETAGRQRTGTPLDLHEMLDITREKGGASVLLFRSIIDEPMDAREEAALFAFGGLVQLCDDVTDLWFDHRDGISTVPLCFAQKDDLRGLRIIFENEVNQVKALFGQMHKLPGRAYAWEAARILPGIARVCLDRYEEIRQKCGNLPLDDRKKMVVDMERLPNRLRLVHQLFND